MKKKKDKKDSGDDDYSHGEFYSYGGVQLPASDSDLEQAVAELPPDDVVCVLTTVRRKLFRRQQILEGKRIKYDNLALDSGTGTRLGKRYVMEALKYDQKLKDTESLLIHTESMLDQVIDEVTVPEPDTKVLIHIKKTLGERARATSISDDFVELGTEDALQQQDTLEQIYARQTYHAPPIKDAMVSNYASTLEARSAGASAAKKQKKGQKTKQAGRKPATKKSRSSSKKKTGNRRKQEL